MDAPMEPTFTTPFSTPLPMHSLFPIAHPQLSAPSSPPPELPQPSNQTNAADSSLNNQPATTKTAFPQARVKTIMREDKDVASVSHDAVFAVTLATEMFLEYLVQKSYSSTKTEGRKIVSYKDVSRAVADNVDLAFLEGN